MNISTKLLFLPFFLFCFVAFSQDTERDWRSMMFDHSNNFFEIQESFYKEFGDEPAGKGTGRKQFKRWEYYWQYRIDKDGNFPDPDLYRQNASLYQKRKPADLRGYEPGNGNWQVLGPFDKPLNGTSQVNGNGRLSSIAFHPTNPNIIYVGAPSGGFWKSTDLGATWTQYISGFQTLGVTSIVIHPTNPDIMYIGTGDRDNNASHGMGVFKSSDGGLTWSSTAGGSLNSRSVSKLLMHPSNPEILIVCTTDARIYRTTNGGNTWTESVNFPSNLKDMAFHPTNPNIIYTSGTSFYKSTDNGITFTQITSGVPTNANRMAIAVSPAAPNRVNIVAGNGNGFIGLYRSTNSGNSFIQMSSSPNILGYERNGSGNSSQSWYDLTMASDPTNADILYVGGVNLWKSIDGGSTWNNLTYWVTDVHADQHVLVFHPQTGDIYNGNDGGIYTSSNGGNSWTELSSGLGIAQLYKIGVSQSEDAFVINGYQDNGTALYNSGTFKTEIGGDGMECIIDPDNSNYIYGSLYYGDLRRSTNKGNSFSNINGNISESGAWVTPFKLAPDNTNTMYIGMVNIWRNTNVKNSSSWSKISSFGGTSKLIDLNLAPSDPNKMYVSSNQSSTSFMRSDNITSVAPIWINLSSNLPSGVTKVLDIEIDHSDPSHVFITTNNRKIYESTNGGQSWTDFSGTLPNDVKNTLIIDPTSTVEAIYVGTDFGVHYRDNTMSDWADYNNGMPPVSVRELEIYTPDENCKSKLYAATYGQGLFVSDLKDVNNLAPIACFSVSETNLCSDNTVKIYNSSIFQPTSYQWTITPASYNFDNGTNQFSAEPEVTFTSSTIYSIALTVSNAYGTDTKTETDYINVSASENGDMYDENFDNINTCSTSNNCGATSCSISSFWINQVNGTIDDIDFRVNNGNTPSSDTGPTVDYNTGTSQGHYIYTEASACYNQTAVLESGCITLDQEYDFTYAYHMYGADQGELHLDLLIDGEWYDDIVPVIIGDQGNMWKTVTVDLSSHLNSSIKLRIRAITGNSFRSDIALDAFEFVPQNPLPLTLLDFNAVVEDQRVKLSWSTTNEINLDNFVIERSENGLYWESLLEQEASGRFNTINNYATFDSNPLKYISYYRLKSIDKDGSYYYSDIEKIYFHDQNMNIYPNPADESLTILKTNVAMDHIVIQNLQGIKYDYKISSESPHKMVLDISEIPNGFYFVILNDISGSVNVRRIFIH